VLRASFPRYAHSVLRGCLCVVGVLMLGFAVFAFAIGLHTAIFPYLFTLVGAGFIVSFLRQVLRHTGGAKPDDPS
jgi:hypothetical protein